MLCITIISFTSSCNMLQLPIIRDTILSPSVSRLSGDLLGVVERWLGRLGSKPVQHLANRTDANHRLTGVRPSLVIFAQTPIPSQPRMGSLDNPTNPQRLESFCAFWPATDLQSPCPVTVLLQEGHELVIVILVVGKDRTQPREIFGINRLQNQSPADGVIDIRRRHYHGDQQSQGVRQDVALASLHQLAAIKAFDTTDFRRLHTLAVDARRARRRLAFGLRGVAGHVG